MCKDSPKTLDPDEVREIVRRHHCWAVAAVGVLVVALIILMVGYGVRLRWDDLPPDFAVNWSLLLGGFVLALFYGVVVACREKPFKKTPSRVLTGERKELYEALTPERYIIAGSALTVLFIIAVLVAVLLGWPVVVDQALTLLVGIAFVTPLGVVLNKWGALGEYYDKS